ncbi:MAG TPA: arylesterase [Aquabacterium sp.]|nr:arylesterase [Aquabacterium sp.]HEX5312294.1 arylesterase [Aquabacterium sp.]
MSRLLAASLFWVMPFAHGSSPTGLTVLVAGDSLSAEYGIARGQGWVQLVQDQLKQDSAFKKTPVNVVNASISGETTAGGRTRLPALLAQHQPQFVVIELGANDALRGLDIRSTRANLEAMVAAAQAAKAKVLLIGMQVPPNYGKRYTEDFAKAFADVAQAKQTRLMPFLLKDVADRPDAKEWFQPDGLHPLAKAHPVVARNVMAELRPLLLGR